jgi:dTDP-glucose pyrophosphorylase/thiamine kinase-like enzyme
LGIIPAAGKGLRFKELGRRYPKAILPYNEKPIIVHNILALEALGCDEIVVVVGHLSEEVKDAVSMFTEEISAEVLFAVQEDADGLSGAVCAGLGRVVDDRSMERLSSYSTAIMLGDLVFSGDAPESALEHVGACSGNVAVVSTQTVPDFSRWCMVGCGDSSDGVTRVTGFLDKPENRPGTDQALSGFYYFSRAESLKQALDYQFDEDVRVRGEFQLSSAMELMMREGTEVLAVEWEPVDFGTLAEYLENRGVSGSRSFNSVVSDSHTIKKSSKERAEKVLAEINWFRSLPMTMAARTPRVLETKIHEEYPQCSYTMERVYAPSLRELLLFLGADRETWDSAFSALNEFVSDGEKYGRPNGFLRRMVTKTRERVKEVDVEVSPRLVEGFLREMSEQVTLFERERPAVVHGDLCFSNILFDPQYGKVKLVDPRGDVFGSAYYEYAKLAHSALYRYDYIDAELYCSNGSEVRFYDKGRDVVKAAFLRSLEAASLDIDERRFVTLLTASLFLSMIPLHAHNRANQELYYEEFRRAYSDYLSDKWVRGEVADN